MNRAPTILPTQAYLNECFEYDELTGSLTWKKRPLRHFRNAHGMNTFNSQYSSKAAGSPNKRGYVIVCIDGKRFLAHRVIWKLMTGEEPVALIDHRDTDASNNRWLNLRQATVQQNGFNRGCPANSRTGRKGVSWDARRKKFFACISVNGKTKGIGRFDTESEAQEAYRRAAESLHGDFANLS